MNPYFQSLVWLVGCGGIGYVLLELTTPSATKIDEIRSASDRHLLHQRDQKKALFMEKLQEAAHGKPVYLKAPQELVQENRKQVGQ